MKKQLKSVVLETLDLVQQALDGMNESLRRFDLPEKPGFPQSYLAYRKAVDACLALLPLIEAGQEVELNKHMALGKQALDDSRKAFDSDQQMHNDIERALDEEMGIHDKD